VSGSIRRFVPPRAGAIASISIGVHAASAAAPPSRSACRRDSAFGPSNDTPSAINARCMSENKRVRAMSRIPERKPGRTL